jgi:hypothetical protein
MSDDLRRDLTSFVMRAGYVVRAIHETGRGYNMAIERYSKTAPWTSTMSIREVSSEADVQSWLNELEQQAS